MIRNMRGSNMSDLPDIKIGRSSFRKEWTDLTSVSEGELFPVAVLETVPGGSYSMNVGAIIRMSTPVFPVMDGADITYFAHYIPNRLVWVHWPEFIGANDGSYWDPQVVYTVPQLKFNKDFYNEIYGPGAHDTPLMGAMSGSLANRLSGVHELYYGSYADGAVPNQLSISDLPNRGYRRVWNEWFRDESYQEPVYVPMDDNDRSYMDDVGDDFSYGHDLLRANRLRDFFSTVKPAPQSGDPVLIPFGSGPSPVVTSETDGIDTAMPSLHWRKGATGAALTGSDWGVLTTPQQGESVQQGTFMQAEGFVNEGEAVYPSNLFTTANLFPGTISELRTAFQVQKILEQYARSGRRYTSLLDGIYGVKVPDSVIQRTEFLGSFTRPINMQEVVQTSQSTASSPMGALSAMSKTVVPMNNFFFSKSTDEAGMILITACIRVRHTYASAINPFFFRKNTFDFWNPKLNLISDQPVRSKVYCPTGFKDADEQVFGYQPAWEDMRTHFNTVSGLFSPSSTAEGYESILSAWTYATIDQPTDQPFVCNDEFLREPSEQIAQTLAVPSAPQFLINTGFRLTETTGLSLFGIPGYVDHL